MGEITNLNIATGLREFNLNGKVTVTFNPTDQGFIEKVYHAFDELDKQQSEVKERVDGADLDGTFALMREMNERMKTILNDLFGVDIVTPLIGNTSLYALSDGAPIWCNILFAVLDTMEDEIAEQNKKSRARMLKYTAKYEAEDHKKKNK